MINTTQDKKLQYKKINPLFLISSILVLFIFFFIFNSEPVNAQILLIAQNGTGGTGNAMGYDTLYEGTSIEFDNIGAITVSSVKYWMLKNNFPTFNMDLYLVTINPADGKPITQVGKSIDQINAGDITTLYLPYEFNFSDVDLEDGVAYGLVLNSTEGASYDTSNYIRTESNTDGGVDPYRSFKWDLSGGGEWSTFDNTDEAHFEIYGIFTEAEISVEGFLINKSYDDYVLNEMDVNDLFNGKANYSMEGETLSTGVCEWNTTIINVILTDAPKTSNYSLGYANPLNLTFSESLSGVVNEEIIFRVCRQLLPKRDVLININSTLFKTVSSDIIPLCSIGFHEEAYLRNTNIGQTETISLSCPSCLSDHMRIIQQDDWNIKILRLHTTQNESMTYNITDGFYYDTDFNEDKYSFLPGMHEITFTCSGTSDVIEVNVASINPTAVLLSIKWDDTTQPFINGTITESSLSTNITGECFGDVINFTQINVTNSTGSLIKSVNNEFINLANTDLINNDNYTVKLYCVNQFGNISTDTRFFEVKDTTFPSIVWNNPLNTNTTEETVNFLFQIDVDVYDVNLFAYNLLVRDPANNIIINNTKLDLNTTSEKIISTYRPNITGTYTAITTVSDDHTSRKIPDYDYAVIDDSNIQFNITEQKGKIKKVKGSINIDYVSGLDRNIEIVKLEDRYIWYYNFLGDVGGKTKHKIRVSCPSIIYREYSKYNGHFICPETNNWIDFVSNDVSEYEIKELGNDKYEIKFSSVDKRSIQMESIGGLNIVSEQISFNVVEASTSTNTTLLINECPGTLEGVGILFIILLIVLSFVVLALVTQKGILYILAGLSLLVFSWTIYGCQALFGALLGVSAMFLIIYSIIKKPV